MDAHNKAENGDMSQVNLKNPFDRWMVARNVEYAESEGVDKVAARLRAQGYNRVADAVEAIVRNNAEKKG